VVRGRRTAGLDADRPALRLDRLRDLREVHADVVVLRADVGDAQRLVLLEQVAVPGQHRDAGGLGLLQRPAHGGRVGRRDGDAVDLAGDQVVHDLDLLLAAAVLAGPMYSQRNLPAFSVVAFMQPSRAWSKNGLFMFFGTSAKTYSFAAAGESRHPAPATPRRRRHPSESSSCVQTPCLA
jgi:hypothetical protein